MKYSALFGKTLRQPPKEAETVNHRLLSQAGYVDQLMAGVYTYLPLGLLTLRKIEHIVREEMNAIGGQEILMPALHPAENWKVTGGWDNIDVLFKIKSRTEKDYALGQSEEEVVTPLVLSRVQTYKDLPQQVYQINWKYRDELRAKSGILRGREFLMKDMYSFHEDQADFLQFYDVVKQAYLKIYDRLGLTAKVTEASGGAFTKKISYEFMVLTEAGEDDILYCDNCEYCVNTEIATVKEGEACPKCGKGSLKLARASEVGNVFDLGQKYSKDFDLSFVDAKGQKQYAVMGCYGIGISRIMGVIAETYHDSKGLLWPAAVAPCSVYLISLDETGKTENSQKAAGVYDELQSHGISVLWDDRADVSAGVKFADADLIGLPVRLVISAKTQDQIEYKERTSDQVSLVSVSDVIDKLAR